MTHHVERSKEVGLDIRTIAIAGLLLLLVASVLTKGFSQNSIIGAKGKMNASELLDSYLANSGNDTMLQLQSVKDEVDLRIYRYQLENEPPVTLMVISDSNCNNCYTDRVVKVSQQLFPKLQIDGVIDYNSTGGKLIAKKYGITVLPAYIFSSSVEQAANFNQIAPDLIKVGSDYVINPQITGASFPAY